MAVGFLLSGMDYLGNLGLHGLLHGVVLWYCWDKKADLRVVLASCWILVLNWGWSLYLN